MKFYIAVVSFLTEVPAFLRSASTQYRRTLSPVTELKTEAEGVAG